MEVISNILYYLLPFLLVLTTLVFVHEFGHFIVARIAGVRVDVFSIGFGKELFGFNDRYGTRWKFSAIPLGGYIKMYGDKSEVSNSNEDLVASLSAEEKKIAFPCQSLPVKAAIVVAGPVANYLLALIVFTGFCFFYGAPNGSSIISQVLPNSPANKIGIVTGDTIMQIDGHNIASFNDIKNAMVSSVGDAVNIVIKRDNVEISKEITPQVFIEKDIVGNEAKTYKLGVIVEHVVFEKLGLLPSIKFAAIECYDMSVASLEALGQIITGKRSVKELGGPIRIAQYSAKSAALGAISLIWFIALLSVNLGLMNLLPIPALDGGHLFFYLIEAIMGKKIASKIQSFGLQIGIIILIMLTILVTINDVISLNLFKS